MDKPMLLLCTRLRTGSQIKTVPVASSSNRATIQIAPSRVTRSPTWGLVPR